MIVSKGSWDLLYLRGGVSAAGLPMTSSRWFLQICQGSGGKTKKAPPAGQGKRGLVWFMLKV
jgi:hypothetical protein